MPLYNKKRIHGTLGGKTAELAHQSYSYCNPVIMIFVKSIDISILLMLYWKHK